MNDINVKHVQTCAVLANGAQLVAAIASRIIKGHASQKFNGMDLEEGQIINLAQSVFQTELLKKIG